MIDSFYNDSKTDFKYPEIGICMESSDEDFIKISIPIATPTLPLDEAYDNYDLPVKKTNLVSPTSTLNIKSCCCSNYITVRKPDTMDKVNKGDKVILLFIGGNINNPVIIGRYY